MFPLLGDEKRRRVNLGGRSGLSHAAVIGEAKTLRNLRQHQKVQVDSAVRLQAQWRGILGRRALRLEIKTEFEAHVLDIIGLRCLALLGEEDMLSKWSAAVLSSGEETLFGPALGSNRESWLILIRKVAVLLIRSVAGGGWESYLRILNLLLLPVNARRHMGTECEPILRSITSYIHDRHLYSLLSTCFRAIPVQTKMDPSLPLLVPLTTAPFDVFAEGSPEYAQAFTSHVAHILTIPLLPNRLPISSLTVFSSKLPLSALRQLNDNFSFISSIGSEGSLNLLANLLAFTPARYSKLSSDSLESYLRLLTALMESLPSNSLDTSASPNSWQYLDSDSEPESNDDELQRSPPIQVDQRTLKRLQTLPSSSHISSLLRRTWNTKALIGFIIALTTAWPSRKTDIMTAVLVYPGAGSLYVTQLYHDSVRDSIIGQQGRETSFLDPDHASLIPPFMLLLDLYTQTLATMGDDEFFSTTEPSANRQLLKVVWTLYFRCESGAGPQVTGEAGRDRISRRDWIDLRNKAVKCLLAIHARDSRRPFTPEGHWLECAKINLQALLKSQHSAYFRKVVVSQLAYFSPRLGILNNVPFAIPFFTRVAIFQRFVANNRNTLRANNPRRGRHSDSSGRLTIRRGHLAQDGFEQLQEVDLRDHISVTFIDKLGLAEGNAGHRGLYKEFFTAICKEVFDSERGLWFSSERHEIYPSPQSHARSPFKAESLRWFRFIGRILGKAIYDGILIDFAFAGFFLAKWLGRQGYLDDLASLDPALYKGLIFLKHYAGDVEDLSLNFTVDVDVDAGTTQTIELLPDGNNIPVTKENRLQYIYLISHFRLSRQIKLQSEAFFQGLSEVIELRWFKMFNQQELQVLLGGADSGIDIADLKGHTVVETFDQKQRRALLHFVTSCSRPPLLGFKDLRPNFTIQDMCDRDDHLPGAATCSNLLLLPRYKDEAMLKKKLLSAIMSESGF
ncbi:hypothetical protein B0H10DRAFT_2164909 [Mycena sp. CBHHK59/15]|nr:hypothetical protein B0H10DRAFT_2164909 [Mycena sp. CBHHK59/15]